MEYAVFDNDTAVHHSHSETNISNLHSNLVTAHIQNEPVSRAVTNNLNQFSNFEFSNYPMTNPPLFDQTMFINYNQSGNPIPGRRISISNGQIGQIVNHEAIYNDSFFDDPFDDQEISRSASVNKSSQLPNIDQSRVFPRHLPQPPQADAPSLSVALLDQPLDQLPLPNNLAPQVQVSYSVPAGGDQINNPKSADHALYAGVPPSNYQLIYNNEVIYNPNNGPVPGTAAWKKDRLLERNRVAASKCRRRKKEAQRQLIDDLKEVKADNLKLQNKIKHYKKLFTLFQTFYEKTSNFERIDSFKHFNVLSNALKTKTEDELFEILESFDDTS